MGVIGDCVYDIAEHFVLVILSCAYSIFSEAGLTKMLF